MSRFNYDRIQRVVVIVGVVVVGGLWLAEEAGLILVAPQAAPLPASASAPLPSNLPPGQPMPALSLQGVIAGNDAAPGVAILAELGKRPILVPEGSSFNDDIRVERVLPDRVLLRRRGDSDLIVLPVSLQPGSDPLGPPQRPANGSLAPSSPSSEIPMPPPGAVPPAVRDEPLPANRLPAPVDASGPPPGPGLSGPPLPGPVASER